MREPCTATARSTSRRVKPPSSGAISRGQRQCRADEALQAVAAASAEDRAWEILLQIAGAHAEGGSQAATRLGCLAEEASQLLEVSPAPKASIADATNAVAAATARRSALPQQTSSKGKTPLRRQVATTAVAAAPVSAAVVMPARPTAGKKNAAVADVSPVVDTDAGLESWSCEDVDSDFEAVVAVAEEARMRYGDITRSDRSTLADTAVRQGEREKDSHVNLAGHRLDEATSNEATARRLRSSGLQTPPTETAQGDELPSTIGSGGGLRGALAKVGTVMEVLAAAAADEPLPPAYEKALQEFENSHIPDQQAMGSGVAPEDEEEDEDEEEEEDDARCVLA